MNDLVHIFKGLLKNVVLFSEYASGIKLRDYQREVAEAIVDSVINRKGLAFTVIFPRQSGKNELQAQIEAYILTLLQNTDCEMVKISPTWKPQSLNAMRRLERVLKKNMITQGKWEKEQGYIYRLGSARIYFFSGSPKANIVGATARTLLACDEAQDIMISKWDKEISPMAASTNATKVFWGTAWTSKTLLAREKRRALKLEETDGIKRFFTITADEVSESVEEYGIYVRNEIANLGKNHPFIRTQFFSEEVDQEALMFSVDRLELMKGFHPPHITPQQSAIYAFLIDLGGVDFSSRKSTKISGDNIPESTTSRDQTILTIIEMKVGTRASNVLGLPTYQVVHRRKWTGTSHRQLYQEIRSLMELWKPWRTVIDSSGLGAGLTSFLKDVSKGRIIPFVFSYASKSSLGWNFISIIETGRYKEFSIPVEKVQNRQVLSDQADLQTEFWNQLRYCEMEIQPGPNRRIKWGVPDQTRDQNSGKPVHDDMVISASLCTVLDEIPLPSEKAHTLIKAVDPLKEIDKQSY